MGTGNMPDHPPFEHDDDEKHKITSQSIKSMKVDFV
jgi:hypothetical protein